MPKLRSTYDGHLFYKRSYEESKVFLGTIHLQNCKTVLELIRKLAYDIPQKFF